jgi:AraC-like DNA-binding protein
LQGWQTIRSSVFERHSHDCAYVAIVLSGGYEEAGDHGRFKAVAGNAILHQRFEAHINRFPDAGAVVLNLTLPAQVSIEPGLATIADPDLIVRIAEQSHADAVKLLLCSIRQRESNYADWPDELACALIANPSLSLSTWGQRKGLMPWAISRGFMQVFGVSPAVFRARARARRAWNLVARRGEPLATIATDLGFADQSHMTRSVKLLTGTTPRMWRKAAN